MTPGQLGMHLNSIRALVAVKEGEPIRNSDCVIDVCSSITIKTYIHKYWYRRIVPQHTIAPVGFLTLVICNRGPGIAEGCIAKRS